jgi:hypothetical protein
VRDTVKIVAFIERQRRSRDQGTHEVHASSAGEGRDELDTDGVCAAHSVEPEHVHVCEVDEHVDRADHADPTHERPGDAPRSSAHHGRQIGRFVPATVGQQDEDHREAQRRRPRTWLGWRGLGREPQAADDHHEQSGDEEPCHELLHGGPEPQPEDVETNEHDQQRASVECAPIWAQGRDPLHVVTKHEREQRERAGPDDRDACPREQERHVLAERASQEVVLTARVRKCRNELRVAERAHDRQHTAEQPQRDERSLVRGAASYERGRAKDAHADDDAHDDRDCIGYTQVRHRSSTREIGLHGRDRCIGCTSRLRIERS